jgi:hypothetical protein
MLRHAKESQKSGLQQVGLCVIGYSWVSDGQIQRDKPKHIVCLYQISILTQGNHFLKSKQLECEIIRNQVSGI